MRAFVPKGAKKKGSWQIIYIDLMTNIMIFFVILWSISKGQGKGMSDTEGDVKTRFVSLPADVLFKIGSSLVSSEGLSVFQKLFGGQADGVLNFETGSLSKRMLVIHGHTDGDGQKTLNFDLGYKRALASFLEISRYSKDIPDHITICSHADNLPSEVVPKMSGPLSRDQKELLNELKKKNRRIEIEDRIVNWSLPKK